MAEDDDNGDDNGKIPTESTEKVIQEREERTRKQEQEQARKDK